MNRRWAIELIWVISFGLSGPEEWRWVTVPLTSKVDGHQEQIKLIYHNLVKPLENHGISCNLQCNSTFGANYNR